MKRFLSLLVCSFVGVTACGSGQPPIVLEELVSPDSRHVAALISQNRGWLYSNKVENIEIRRSGEPAESGTLLFPSSDITRLEGIGFVWLNATSLVVRYDHALVGPPSEPLAPVVASRHDRTRDLSKDSCAFREPPLQNVGLIRVEFACNDREALEVLSETLSPDRKYAATYYRRNDDDYNVEVREAGIPLGWGADLFHGSFRQHEPKVIPGPLNIENVEFNWSSATSLEVTYQARESSVVADVIDGKNGIWTRHEVDRIRISYRDIEQR